MAHFYLDHNVARLVGVHLVGVGHEATASVAVGMDRATDDEQLLFAARRSWVLVTHNAHDFALLHHAWRGWASAWGVAVAHAGVLVLPGGRRTPDWLADQLVDALTQGISLLNELYTWRVGRGWVRSP